MKTHLLTFLLLSFLTQKALGQTKIDYAEIKQHTTDSTSVYFYSKIAQQFLKSPAELDIRKLQYLYYGKLYSKYYKLYKVSEPEATFNKYYTNQSYQKAIQIGEQLLQQTPGHLELLVKLYQCYQHLNMKYKVTKTKDMIDLIVGAITSIQDGLSKETAYELVSVGDEYALLAVLGKKGKREGSTMGKTAGGQSGTTDLWKVMDKNSKQNQELFMTVIHNLDAMPQFK